MSDVLDYFGETLINEVRDRTIRLYDKKIHGTMVDEASRKIYSKLSNFDEEHKAVLEEIIAGVVDLSLHNMLCVLDEHEDIKVLVNEDNIAEVSDGLAGELYTEDGWIERFSKQRYYEQ